MNVSLLVAGTAELVFGVGAVAVALTISARSIRKLLKFPALSPQNPSESQEKVHTSVGLVYAASCLATAWIIRSAVSTPFEALQLMSSEGLGLIPLLKCAAYGAIHVLVATAVGIFCTIGGVVVFDRLTEGVEEVEAVKKGELAPACVLASVIIAIALVVSPGLDLLLQGTLPLPTLQGDGLRSFR